MKRFCFTYDLALNFSHPVSRHTFMLRFVPPSDAAQQLWGVDFSSDPAANLPVTRDAFGNRCVLGHIEDTHNSLSLYVRGDAVLRGVPVKGECPIFYKMHTPLTEPDDAIRALADGLTGTAEDAAMQAAARIIAKVPYTKGVTSERTTAAQALKTGGGVCQDLAHLLISVMRVRGVPARYVAGLIPGEGETHAWVEVYDGARFIGIDPTHQKPVDDSYLRVNVGRDSRDCAINRGLFSGFAQQAMKVTAKMIEI